MQKYETLEAFIADFPALAEGARERLKNCSGAFRLETNEGGVYEAEILPDGHVSLGGLTREPDCTVSASERDLLAIIQGTLSPAKALLLRRLKVRGQIAKLMALIALVDKR